MTDAVTRAICGLVLSLRPSWSLCTHEVPINDGTDLFWSNRVRCPVVCSKIIEFKVSICWFVWANIGQDACWVAEVSVIALFGWKRGEVAGMLTRYDGPGKSSLEFGKWCIQADFFLLGTPAVASSYTRCGVSLHDGAPSVTVCCCSVSWKWLYFKKKTTKSFWWR